MKYEINYTYGRATLYTPSHEWHKRFHELADQCFGIRKSIGLVQLMSESNERPIDMLPEEYERLEHDGDVIIWNAEGEKIKSEWD